MRAASSAARGEPRAQARRREIEEGARLERQPPAWTRCTGHDAGSKSTSVSASLPSRRCLRDTAKVLEAVNG